MSDTGFDVSLLIGLHKLAEQNGDGLAPHLLERLRDSEAMEPHSADIVALPGLHERAVSRNRHLASGLQSDYGRGGATVLSFPMPRWQRNAKAVSGE